MGGVELLPSLFLAAGVMSILSALLFAFDKIMALAGKSRVPEGYLMLSALCLGAFGGLFSMVLFNHKVRRPLFYIGVPLLLFAQMGLAAYLKYLEAV